MTSAEPSVSGLEDLNLDFNIECKCTNIETQKSCNNQAKWLIAKTCCHDTTSLCDYHFLKDKSSTRCANCHTYHANITFMVKEYWPL